jgi:hypothetical protein
VTFGDYSSDYGRHHSHIEEWSRSPFNNQQGYWAHHYEAGNNLRNVFQNLVLSGVPDLGPLPPHIRQAPTIPEMLSIARGRTQTIPDRLGDLMPPGPSLPPNFNDLMPLSARIIGQDGLGNIARMFILGGADRNPSHYAMLEDQDDEGQYPVGNALPRSSEYAPTQFVNPF